MIAFGVYPVAAIAFTKSTNRTSWPPTATISGFCAATTPATGARSAFGGNSEKCTTFSPASSTPLRKPWAVSSENGSLAPTTAAVAGLGFAVFAIDWIERAAVVSTAGMTPKVNAGCFFQMPGDSAEPAMHGTLYLAQIGSIAICTPLVYAPKIAFTPSSVASRDVASAAVPGSLLQSCTTKSTLYFLSPIDSPPFAFTVSAQSWYPRWAIWPPVADAPDSSSTAPTLNVSVDVPPPVSPPHALSRLGPATTPPTTRPARVRKPRRLM